MAAPRTLTLRGSPPTPHPYTLTLTPQPHPVPVPIPAPAPAPQVIREVTDETSYDSYLIAAKLGKEFKPLNQSPHQVQNAVRDEVIQKRMSSVLENIEAEAVRCKSPTPGPTAVPLPARSHTLP